jgi:hypothetical protein
MTPTRNNGSVVYKSVVTGADTISFLLNTEYRDELCKALFDYNSQSFLVVVHGGDRPSLTITFHDEEVTPCL